MANPDIIWAFDLRSLCALGSVAISDSSAARFSIPSGASGDYRVAQLDDYTNLPRKDFKHSPPLSLKLEARLSARQLPGTWGFGFWNDPFALGIGVKGSGIRLPALPQAVWFFYGSPCNDLSFQSKTAANGLTAGVFSSAEIPPILLPLALPAILFLPIKPAARFLRRLISRVIHDEYQSLSIDPIEWHFYQIDWLSNTIQFRIDGVPVFSSRMSPQPPLGLVIWIDNQYAGFTADGTLRFGTEANPEPAWMEIRNTTIQNL